MTPSDKAIEDAKAAANVAVKSGWKTTEFWITGLTAVGSVAAAVVGVLPASAAATVAAVSAGAYALARGIAKLRWW